MLREGVDNCSVLKTNWLRVFQAELCGCEDA